MSENYLKRDNNEVRLKTKSKSLVWNYFGIYFVDDIQSDETNYHCKLCFEAQESMRYKMTNGTSTLFTHLKVKHNILPEINLPEASKFSCSACNLINQLFNKSIYFRRFSWSEFKSSESSRKMSDFHKVFRSQNAQSHEN
jgi:hypothetical protein